MAPPELRNADPALMRRINAVNTLRALYHGAPMTLTRIVEATGLARRTAEAAIERLIEQGLAVALAPSAADRTVGRPARSFRFRSEAGYVLGIDIGVHEVTALLADLGGNVKARSELVVARTANRAQRVGVALDAAERCRKDAGISPDDIWATTAGTPGVVEGSAYVSLCHVLPEWSEFSLADELGTGIPGTILAENDTNLSAVAERWRGVAQGVDSMVWVLTGRRIGAAIVVDGRLYRGADGAAGEIGWLPELGWSRLSEQPLSFTGADRTRAGETAATTVRRALAGDEDALREIDAFAAGLAPGLTALALALNPRCLVIGGGITVAGDALLAAVASHMRPHCLRMPDLRTSTLGADSVALGAVRHSLDHVENLLFSPDHAAVVRSRPASGGSALDAARRQPGHDPLLEDQRHYDHREGHDHRQP